MKSKSYSGSSSRIVLGTLKPASNSDDEDIFLSESIADRPELRVQLRYFTVELKPSRCSIRTNCGNNGSKSTDNGDKSSPVNGQKKADLGKKVSFTETTSCDSFHSCRSTTSIQELTCKGNGNDISTKTKLEKLESGTKRTAVRDNDLLNHLTMVNAIFLSKSVSDSTHHDWLKKNHQDNGINPCKTDSLSIPRIPSSSNKVCSEAYTCQIRHNPRVKYISKIYENNIVTKPVISSVDPHNKKVGGETRLTYTKTFSESFEPVLNTTKSSFESLDNIYDRSDLSTDLNEESQSNLAFPQKVCSDPYFSTFKRLETKFPKMKFAEIIPLCDESFLPIVLERNIVDTKPKTDHGKRRTVPGCEESLKFITPKNSLSLLSAESEDNALDSTDIFHGDGNYSGYAYTENSEKGLNKWFLNKIDENYLKKLISKSFKKIRNESKWNLREQESDESDIFESDEEYDGLNDYTGDGVKENISDSAQPNLQFKKLRLQSCGVERDLDLFRADGIVEREDDHSLPMREEDDCDNNYGEQSSELVTIQPENGFRKRGTSERTRTLPVIQEESCEESEDFREDDLADDYCLIDSNGRPIHLFDDQGLPLTDNSGRPLRSAQGKLLMNCDTNGIPVVDLDCSIFDMFGRQPHEDRFDPSMAPKMAMCSKLSASDGRPLLLFDAQGRPLTSVSGTMLVDSSGRGLVRLSNAADRAL